MALLYVEQPSKYGTTLTDLETHNDSNNSGTAWEVQTGGQSAALASRGRWGGKSMYFDDNPVRGVSIPWVAKTADTTIIISMAIYQPGYSEQTDAVTQLDRQILMDMTTTATVVSGVVSHWAIGWCAGGSLIFYHQDNTAGNPTAIIGRAERVLQPRTWHHLEVKVVMLNAGSGSMTVKLDGVQIFTDTTSDFLNTTTTLGFLNILGGSYETMYDDLVVCDSTGSAPFNNFFGDIRLESVVPDADGNYTQWTPTAGSNFQNIDDALGAYDINTTTISEATTDEKNTASHTNISLANATTIFFTKFEALARADAAAEEIALIVRSGGTDDIDPDIPLVNGLTAYRWRYRYDEINPISAAAWTAATINAAEFGVSKRV